MAARPGALIAIANVTVMALRARRPEFATLRLLGAGSPGNYRLVLH